MTSNDREELTLNDAATHLLEECRMVLPGMQALFGFQLIAVFNSTFTERLSRGERLLHLTAIVLVTIAIALVMTPAALHRRMEPLAMSRRFIDTSSRLLMASMPALAAGICLDIYLVSRLTLGTRGVAAAVAVVVLAVFVALWAVLPRVAHRRS